VLQNTSMAREWRVTFRNGLGGTNVAQMTVNTTGLSAFGGITKIEATNTQGGLNNEVQQVTLSNANGGTFRLAFMGQTTAPIAYNASASTVEAKLEELTSLDQVTVTGSAGGPWTITFAGTHAGLDVSRIDGDAAGTTSGTLIREIEFTYDAAGQLTAASDPDSSYAYEYDNLGRVTTVDNNGTPGVTRVVLTAGYDATGNRTTLAA